MHEEGLLGSTAVPFSNCAELEQSYKASVSDNQVTNKEDSLFLNICTVNPQRRACDAIYMGHANPWF
jgi:hypothetical protein